MHQLHNAHIVAYWQHIMIGFFRVGMIKLSAEARIFMRQEQKAGEVQS